MTSIESGFIYRKRLRYTGSIDGALTDYQMKLTVYKGIGVDSVGVVYLNNHCQDDFDDIRFTTIDGATLMDYWVESYVSGVSAVVWIEFAYFPASPNTIDFYIYYDKATATSQSNGSGTFPWYEDIENYSIADLNGQGAWTGAANYKVSNALPYSGTLGVRKIVNAHEHIVNDAVSQTKGKFVFHWRQSAISDSAYIRLQQDATIGSDFSIIFGADEHIKYRNNGGDYVNLPTDTTYVVNTWYEVEVVFDTVTDKYVSIKIDSVEKGSNLASVATSSVNYVRISSPSASDVYFDDLRIAKYTANEPTFDSWGSEEKIYEKYDATLLNSSAAAYYDTYAAQTFTVGAVGLNETHICTGIRLLLSRIGSLNIGYGPILRIYEVDEEGKPKVGTEYCKWAGTIPKVQVPESPTNAYVFTIDDIVSSLGLKAGTKYAIVARYDGGDANNMLIWKGDYKTPDGYVGGQRWTSSDAGATWTSLENPPIEYFDLDFVMYGLPILLGEASGSGVGTSIVSGVTIVQLGGEKTYEHFIATLFDWSDIAYPSSELAQTFTVGTVRANEGHFCTAIKLLLSIEEIGPVGNKTVYVGIYETDEAGTPLKNIENRKWFGTYDGEIPTFPNKEYITITPEISELLEPDTQYAIVVWYPYGQGGSYALRMWGDWPSSEKNYTGGKEWHSRDSGLSWTTYEDPPDYIDYHFEIIGIIPSTLGLGIGLGIAYGILIIPPWQTVQVLSDESIWVNMPFEDTYILETDDKPVREFSFTVAGLDRESAEFGLLTLNRQARIYQFINEIKYELLGRIVQRPKRLEAPSSDVFSVVCYDETHDATKITFIDSWPKSGIETWTEIVIDAWTKYCPECITFDGVENNESEPDGMILSQLGTLFEFMEKVCMRTGWRWRIEQGDLKFFDPLTKISETILTADDIKPDSVIGEDFPEVANVVKVPAVFRVYDFEDIQLTMPGQDQYLLQYKPRIGYGVVAEDFKPHIWYDEVEIDPEDILEDGAYGAEDVIVIFNIENRFIRFHPDAVILPNKELKVIYDVDIPILVVRESADSINLYGRIEHPIRQSPRPIQETAAEIADAYLAIHAFPITGFEAELLEYDVRAATMQRIILETHGIDQLMPVTKVERYWSPSTGFTMKANFQRAPMLDDDLIIDLFRRISRLENETIQTEERVERYANVEDTWNWTEELEFGWSDVNWISDYSQLKHMKKYFGDEGGLLIYTS